MPDSLKFTITAYDRHLGRRIELFRWCRGADAGIARALAEAKEFGQHRFLSNYRAEPIERVAA